MSRSIRYGYYIEDTQNNKVNFEKLSLEIRASSVPLFEKASGVDGDISIKVTEELSVAKKSELDLIVANHDGAVALVSDSEVKERENKIREMTLMAIYHPLLDETETVEYLTSIDNWFNGWKRSGINSILITKIVADASNVLHPQYDFLNIVVNEEGNKTFEFLISVVQ